MAKGSKKVLLQIIDSLYRGGAQKVVVDITKLFPDYKHIVCYWSDEEDFLPELQANEVSVYKIPFLGISSIFKTLKIVNEIVKTENVDIIHTHMFTPNLIGRSLNNREVKIVTTYHGEVFPRKDFRTWVMRVIESRMFLKSKVNIAVSEHVKEDLKRKLNIGNAPIKVLHNYAEQNSLSGYALVNYNQKPLRLIATSNNHPYKNYPLLVDALAAFEETEVILDIYGGKMDNLKQMVAKKGIKNIRFKGVFQNLPEILPSYHIYTAASNSGEGFSLSLLEALNAGMVVLCSDIPQFREAIGDAGFTFKNNSAADFVNKLQWIIDNPSELPGVAQKAKCRGEVFGKESFIEQLSEVYDK